MAGVIRPSSISWNVRVCAIWFKNSIRCLLRAYLSLTTVGLSSNDWNMSNELRKMTFTHNATDSFFLLPFLLSLPTCFFSWNSSSRSQHQLEGCFGLLAGRTYEFSSFRFVCLFRSSFVPRLMSRYHGVSFFFLLFGLILWWPFHFLCSFQIPPSFLLTLSRKRNFIKKFSLSFLFDCLLASYCIRYDTIWYSQIILRYILWSLVLVFYMWVRATCWSCVEEWKLKKIGKEIRSISEKFLPLCNILALSARTSWKTLYPHAATASTASTASTRIFLN